MIRILNVAKVRQTTTQTTQLVNVATTVDVLMWALSLQLEKDLSNSFKRRTIFLIITSLSHSD